MKDTDKKASTKDALLEAAKELFTLKGYSAVSTRELADRAKVNLGSIQYHFGSKANLFIETIRELMSERKERLHRFCKTEVSASEEEAARDICLFIRGVLQDMCITEGPDACRLMHREVLGATSQDPELYEPLVSAFTEEFIRPMDKYLSKLVSVLSPDSNERDVWILTQSIVGQCVYYHTHRPFAEKLRNEDFTTPENMQDVAQRIARFSLFGLGLDEKITERAIAHAFER